MDAAKLPSSALVADHNPYGVRVLRDILLRAGIARVHEALDGAEALSAVSDRRPGLLVLDWELPVVSAREIVDMTRARAGEARVPIIVTMPEPTRSAVEAARERGVDAIVVVPCSPRAFRQRLERVLLDGR